MRLKNVKGATKIVESSPYIIQNPIQYCGHFCDVFQNQNPIYIEIGMGKGNFIIENAKKYPNINFIKNTSYSIILTTHYHFSTLYYIYYFSNFPNILFL